MFCLWSVVVVIVVPVRSIMISGGVGGVEVSWRTENGRVDT